MLCAPGPGLRGLSPSHPDPRNKFSVSGGRAGLIPNSGPKVIGGPDRNPPSCEVRCHIPSGVTLAWITQVARLENGNTIIVNCHAGPDNPQIIEVTPDRKVVWSFKDFKTFGNAMPVAQVLDIEGKVVR